MHASIALVSLIGLASAAVDINNPLLKRDVAALVPRATTSADGSAATDSSGGGLNSRCQSAIESLITGLPSAPSQVQQLEASNTDPCNYTPPASASKAYSSYTSAVLSWYDAHSTEVDAAFKVCTELKSLAGNVIKVCSTDTRVPSALRAAATETSGSSSMGSSTTMTTSETNGIGGGSQSSSSGSMSSGATSTASGESSSNTSTGAAAHETGRAAAAGAAFAAAGLVALAL